MNSYEITKQDIINRVYFIAKLVQKQKKSTMQGALTSKSDSMGGIFDRFINTLSDSLIFNKIIFQHEAFQKLGKEIRAIEDFYYYNPSANGAGIAPDILGIVFDNKIYPFAQFNNKWEPLKDMPQIEVKTFKAKDQMISLRNQNYDDKYLVLVDLDMRIDYLIPFLDQECLSKDVLAELDMDDDVFIKSDDNELIERVSPIDFSSNNIGSIKLIAITNASDFMKQTTLCGPKESVRRVKEVKRRMLKIKTGILHDKLSRYASVSPRIPKLYEFNQAWKDKVGIKDDCKCLDFVATNIEKIEICKYNNNGIIIIALEEGCSFNGVILEPNVQYTIAFETLDRTGNEGSEYFMQKQCACYLNSLEQELADKILSIIE